MTASQQLPVGSLVGVGGWEGVVVVGRMGGGVGCYLHQFPHMW